MTQEIEIEYKNLLTQQEYDRLLKHLPFPEDGVMQTNHYFETPDFSMKDNRIALRIREKNGEFKLTLKEPHPEGLLETHADLSTEEAMSWIAGNPVSKEAISEQLHRHGIDETKLSFFGSLTTLRREAEYNNVQIVLDYNVYNNLVDYEFELEASSKKDGEEAFQSILKQHDIETRTTPNKIERFFLSLKS